MFRRTLPTALLVVVSATLAAAPPPLLNYQGVLRDALNHPLSGSYDMVFRFFSAETLGDEILSDAHRAATGSAVTVSGGLFDVTLGSGAVSDGPGPGTYTSLADVFADYGAVWMEITVGSEALSPRVRVVSSAYALNAGRLDGRTSAGFLDTSTTAQTKAGSLTLSTSSSVGLTASGPMGGATFTDSNGTAVCHAAQNDIGVVGQGNAVGGQFVDLNNGAYANVATDLYGIEARGRDSGGVFVDLDETSYVQAAFGGSGVYAEGLSEGGFFRDLDGLGTARVGLNTKGIEAFGSTIGGTFYDSDSTGYAHVGYGDKGLSAAGSSMGGEFSDTDGSGYAYVGYGDTGIRAAGTVAGAYLSDADGTGFAHVGYGDTGVRAEGNQAGALLSDRDGTGYANVGYGDVGIDARGSLRGGEFHDTTSTGYAYLGYGDYGVWGEGNSAGGYFKDAAASGFARVGWGDYGIVGYGNEAGSYFMDLGEQAYAYLGYDTLGIWALGDVAGGRFEDLGTGTFALVGYGSYTIYGNGNKGFVQNHPLDPGKVVAYVALEGDEAGTYTRGSGRLVNGEARIALGPTFRLVTNPDLGLTVQLTPRDRGASLYAASLTTEELVVRAQEGSAPDARFDFLVMGLRIGFEELSIERPREIPAPIPNLEEDRAAFEKDPGLRETTALSRYVRMRQQAGETGALDLARSRELAEAVGTAAPGARRPDLPEREEPGRAEPAGETGSPEPSGGSGDAGSARTFRVADALLPLLPVSEPVSPGDVLVLDPEHPGSTRLSRVAQDSGVVGVVAGDGEAPDPSMARAATAGVVPCRVDASYGPVRPGDVLVTSPTPGHAMRSDDPAPGTVLGKAMESLDGGTGLVRVLVTFR